MESIDVLIRPDFTNNLGAVQPPRQRQLTKNSIDGRIFVQAADNRHQFVLGRCFRQSDQLRFHADLRAGFFLAGDIRKRRRIIADQNHRQLRHPRSRAAQRFHLLTQLSANVF